MHRTIFLLAATALANAQTGSDIFLAPLKVAKNRVTTGSLVNITNRPGYDNQPSFTPDGRAILFTSIGEDKQADTYRYDLKTGKTDRLTKTAESEFSPTMAPDGKTFFTVRVEADQSQRLWRFQANGDAPQLVLPEIKPVGYFVFAEAGLVALFVLGTPPTLQLADLRSGRAEVIASDIGRPMLKIPGRHTVSFMAKEAGGIWWIKELDPKTKKVTPIVKALEGSDYFAWTPQRILLMAKGTKLFQCNPPGGGEWQEIADVSRKISRLAVNSRGNQIALVGEEP